MDKNGKNTGKGCFSAILGTFLVFVGIVIYAMISSMFNRTVIGSKFGTDIACALLPLSLVGLTVAFVLYEIIFVVWQIKLGKVTANDDGKMKRIFRLVAVGCICLSLLFALISANTYTELREDSIKKVCFTELAEYRWDERCDVQKYTLVCDENANLTYTVTMKDGEKIEILTQVNSCSEAFLEKYGSLYAYAAYLTEQFENSGYIIEGEFIGEEYIETFCGNHSEYVSYVRKIISYCNADDLITE